jgi:NADH-quinone oxidoreductase subunit A
VPARGRKSRAKLPANGTNVDVRQRVPGPDTEGCANTREGYLPGTAKKCAPATAPHRGPSPRPKYVAAASRHAPRNPVPRAIVPTRAMSPYVVFLLYMMAILGFVATMLVLNAVLGPKPAMTAAKLEPFECGATPVDRRNVKAVPIKYYAVAIVFILFDLETVFLFIWALGAQPLNGFMLATFGLFVFLLVLIMLYVYKMKLIEGVAE